MLYRPVLQIEVALKIVSDMVGIAAREGGAYGADHLLGGLCVQTRYVFLQTSIKCRILEKKKFKLFFSTRI